MFVSRIVKAGSDLAVCVVNLLDCYRYSELIVYYATLPRTAGSLELLIFRGNIAFYQKQAEILSYTAKESYTDFALTPQNRCLWNPSP